MSLRHGLQAIVRVVRRRVQLQAQQAARQKPEAGPANTVQPAQTSGPRVQQNYDVLRGSALNLASRASQIWRLAPGPRFIQANGSRNPPSSRPVLPLLLGFAGIGFVSRESQIEENGEHQYGNGSGRADIDLETAIHLVHAVFKDRDAKPKNQIDNLAAEYPTKISGYALSPHVLAKGTEGVIYAAKKRDFSSPPSDGAADLAEPSDSNTDSAGLNQAETQREEQQREELAVSDDHECDLAVKMMFNYNVRLTPSGIMQEFQAEQLPLLLARGNFGNTGKQQRSASLCSSHPNIVTMHQAFVDEVRVPSLESAVSMFDMALPASLNPHGFGADTTMYIIMRRYRTTLRDYLNKECAISDRSAMLIVAQLLEAVTYLGNYGVVHRDLKTNNILLDHQKGEEVPHVLLADFGCALSLRGQNLQKSVSACDRSRQGNTALMAPELKAAYKESHVHYRDYLKSDAWAVGAIIYEICGQKNPFYAGFDSGTYKETSLPTLQSEAVGLRLVTQLLLKRDPEERLSTDIAANILHLFLWQPSASGLLRLCHLESSVDRELTSWVIKIALIHLLQEPLLETPASMSYYPMTPQNQIEQGLLGTFLRRVNSRSLADATRFVVSHFLHCLRSDQQMSSLEKNRQLSLVPDQGIVAPVACQA